MSFDSARDCAELHLRQFIIEEFSRAGGETFDLQWRWRENTITAGDGQLFVDGELTVVAVGRPAAG
jgi:hypothetical protein